MQDMLNAVQVGQAMILNVAQIRKALELGEYLDTQDIRGARFLGVNAAGDTVQFVYEILYMNSESSSVETGRVFVRWHEYEGKYNLVADF